MTVYAGSNNRKKFVKSNATKSSYNKSGMHNNGDLTYYGGAGKNGACTQTWKPSGFKTVAINAAQYNNGRICATCVYACFKDKSGAPP